MARKVSLTQDKYMYESYEDVCEFLLHCCEGKSVYDEPPIAACADSRLKQVLFRDLRKSRDEFFKLCQSGKPICKINIRKYSCCENRYAQCNNHYDDMLYISGKDANHALNSIKSYCELAIKTMCRCIPSWSLLKHGALKSQDISYYSHLPDAQ